jgi:hypothetical protein
MAAAFATSAGKETANEWHTPLKTTHEVPAQWHGYSGAFTSRNGIVGWAQAKARRSPVYGAGAIEPRPTEILLHGWQRTWLGVANSSSPKEWFPVMFRSGDFFEGWYPAVCERFTSKRVPALATKIEYAHR